MINYTIAEFLGIFLIGFPVLVFATTISFWGIRQLIDNFFSEDEDEPETGDKDEPEDEDEEDEEKKLSNNKISNFFGRLREERGRS